MSSTPASKKASLVFRSPRRVMRNSGDASTTAVELAGLTRHARQSDGLEAAPPLPAARQQLPWRGSLVRRISPPSRLAISRLRRARALFRRTGGWWSCPLAETLLKMSVSLSAGIPMPVSETAKLITVPARLRVSWSALQPSVATRTAIPTVPGAVTPADGPRRTVDWHDEALDVLQHARSVA